MATNNPMNPLHATAYLCHASTCSADIDYVTDNDRRPVLAGGRHRREITAVGADCSGHRQRFDLLDGVGADRDSAALLRVADVASVAGVAWAIPEIHTV